MQSNAYEMPHEIEHKLGYRFRDPRLLEAALTHRSFRFENPRVASDNQRLEFLGDAVLGFLLAEWAFHRFKDHPEGILTILRSRVASTTTLGAIARELALGAMLHLGRGEIGAGGADRDSLLADALEALLGAVYLDGGMEAIRGVFQTVFRPSLDSLDVDPWADNPKGRLQQIAQQDFLSPPVYQVLSASGPAHARHFRVEVRIGDHGRAEGEGASKQSAQVAAALALLRQLHPTPGRPESTPERQ